VKSLLVCLAVLACSTRPAPAFAATYKVAWYNIQSGFGQQPLGFGTATFVENSNRVDGTQPLNAWGVGLVQAELRSRIASDPDVIALGLGEAWTCASPENVRSVLGLRTRTGARNGVALIARYGLSAPEEWLELDTSLNLNPRDTKWVIRAPVCVDAACSASVIVYAAHWLGTGDFQRPGVGVENELCVSAPVWRQEPSCQIIERQVCMRVPQPIPHCLDE
jgi:hypothetical protein